MVICDPDIKVFDRLATDKFILMGCDGIFERYIYDQRPLGKMINAQLKKEIDSETILENLVDSLLAKTNKDLYGCDNMTCILIEFKE